MRMISIRFTFLKVRNNVNLKLGNDVNLLAIYLRNNLAGDKSNLRLKFLLLLDIFKLLSAYVNLRFSHLKLLSSFWVHYISNNLKSKVKFANEFIKNLSLLDLL